MKHDTTIVVDVLTTTRFSTAIFTFKSGRIKQRTSPTRSRIKKGRAIDFCLCGIICAIGMDR